MTDSDNAPDGLDDATRFLRALFEPQDIICFRPIETWTEGAKKQSKVIHSDMTWVSDQNGTLKVHVLRMMKMAPAKHANLFFGVAPRFNHKHFDLAWQVRKLNALWSDIDHVSTDEALARCNGAGLPVPSIVINSGNGAHVYWLLDSPYMIDDASAPPAVLTEFIDQGPGKKKKVLKWFKDETGERVELTAKGVAPKLSNKGQFAQDVLQGIAAKIGGDATHDLSRLLRLPGTMNRKDARGGKPPVPCTIVELDQSRRYAFDQFSSFAAQSPDAQRRVKIAAVPLPQPKKLFGKRLEKFEDAVARCAIAEQGSRSEADFAACALAVRSGVAKVDAWAKLQFVGKFAEGGERYFERTWARAEEKAREQKFEVLSGATKTRTKSNPATTNTAPTERHSIELSPFVPVSTTLRQITDYLVQERVIYRRAEQGVVVDGDRIGPVLSPQQFIGLISAHIEFYKQESESVSHTTLPANLANAWFHNPHEQKRLPCIALFTRNPQFVQGWRLTQPGFDEDSGVYYAGPAVAAREGTQHLDAMLEGFCFKKPADRTNLIGMLLTTLCTGKFIGSKPGVIATGNQPSLGKTTLM
ncbi:MAG TPA: hypothetical protein VG713_10935, partial [Pirellulales bacterium]|nr:hypothetical protein [Pirellulales bacterium]